MVCQTDESLTTSLLAFGQMPFSLFFPLHLWKLFDFSYWFSKGVLKRFRQISSSSNAAYSGAWITRKPILLLGGPLGRRAFTTKKPREMNKQPRITNPPPAKGVHYLRKKSCEPVLSPTGLKAELERRKEFIDARSELERRLRTFRSLRPT